MNGALRELVGWLGVLPPLGGAILCALHLGRSRWAAVLTAGFSVETVILLFYRVVTLAMSRGLIGQGGVGAAFLLASLLGLAARTTIVAAVAGVLADLARSAPSTRPGT
jgi:hypothetical protein